jgi:hypothetical protein
VLKAVKEGYIIWFTYYQKIPKIHRYTLGQKIDGLFVDIIEMIAQASFLNKNEKQPYIKVAIRKLDTLKIFLMIMWETKNLDNKKYIHLSEKLDIAGKMLGGWNGQLEKQNSPNK